MKYISILTLGLIISACGTQKEVINTTMPAKQTSVAPRVEKVKDTLEDTASIDYSEEYQKFRTAVLTKNRNKLMVYLAPKNLQSPATFLSALGDPFYKAIQKYKNYYDLEQYDNGRSIIEKTESNGSVSYTIYHFEEKSFGLRLTEIVVKGK